MKNLKPKKLILFSGGGSGGHVIPARTLIKDIVSQGDYDVSYIGSEEGIERKLIGEIQVPYTPIKTGKLRRYLSFQNLLDVFNILLGLLQSIKILIQKRPHLIILTGGFVIVPVVIAGFLLGIPMILHEQTTRIGLANKLASFFVKKIMISFGSSAEFLPKEKTILTGYPVRELLFEPIASEVLIGDVDLAKTTKPILFITGGGNGSALLNNFVINNLEALSERFLIVHQTGIEHLFDHLKFKTESYLPTGFIGDEYISLIKMASCVVSRSGAGTVAELLAIKRRSIFIPLKMAQKNEQYHNAMEAHQLLDSIVISEDDFRDQKKVLEQIINFKVNEANQEIESSQAKEKIKKIIKEELDS